MVELFEQNIKTNDRLSSKGNQLKWYNDNIWYKADYMGYEGLAEHIISSLLEYSTLEKDEYVHYDTELMKYNYMTYTGCRSCDFLPEGWSLITLERLFHNRYNQSLYRSIYTIQDYENRLKFIVDQTIRLTGLKDFGQYMCKLLALDAFFLNEDRHMHNVAVLMDETGEFHYCPIFDNGACLLSDTSMDYPLGKEILTLMENTAAKTFCRNFDEQLEIAERLYGQQVKFRFTMKDVEELLKNEKYYSEEEKNRVYEIIAMQYRKYQYMAV